ncbi:MAG: DinB family protein, partial [Gemmatimonadales bacterium]
DPRPTTMPNADLLAIYDQAFSGASFHGAPLWGSLRGMTAEEARQRPAPGRHSPWELVLHCAYWKCIARQRITGDLSIALPRSGANFPELPAVLHDAEWKRDRALLKREHELLRAVIRGLAPKVLPKRAGKSRWTVRETVVGMASHDLYHAGQIQLIRKLVG